MRRRGWLLAALVAAAPVGCRGPLAAPPQPIPFDHSLHLQLRLDSGELACTDCHPGAARGTRAGLPPLSRCLRCHMRPQGDPPAPGEKAVRLAATGPVRLRWIQVTRNPGHVHFSHGAHVARAGMVCADCHGDVSRWSRPPSAPDADLTDMGRCIACHRARGARTDCGTCHQ
jgi:c(7)-type cytochrome triheme protein